MNGPLSTFIFILALCMPLISAASNRGEHQAGSVNSFDVSRQGVLPEGAQKVMDVRDAQVAPGEDIGRIWVHIDFLGIYTWTLIGVPTAHMLLFDANGVQLPIAPFGCIALSGAKNNWYYSAWGIDLVSYTEPSQEEQETPVCYEANNNLSDCVPGWYPVDIPAGFFPVQYVAGCSIYLPFEVPMSLVIP